ncbi:hypothetical protein Halru_3071 [Halovivax ruber XH-70]|uniref:Uncharacterized protein n=1 Tax=Halovivax ruber (strain DSM 18193 / JCM 13892 / XH-70) TaxID=797302 RepID=L0II25_HALRX|nr:hypothetical protein [Halovivax ruber]AGB17637.1 hypothetical protein Halru_3071 [Halovivax ruber XH-70]
MDAPVSWSFDPATNPTLRWLGWGQLVLVDGWAVLGSILLLASPIVPTGIGPIAGFVTVILTIGRAQAWVETDGTWLDGVEADLDAVANQPVPRQFWGRFESTATADSFVPDAPGQTLYDHRRIVAPAAAALLGGLGYAIGWVLIGPIVVSVAVVAGLAGGLLSGLLDRGRASGEIDPADDRVTYRGRTRPRSSITDWWTVRLGTITLLRCRGPRGLDEPTWLAVPTDRAPAVAAALATESATSTATDRDASGPTGGGHRLRLKAAIVGAEVALIGVGAGFAGQYVHPGTTSGFVLVAVSGAAVTALLSIALLVGVVRGRARRRTTR